MGPSYCFVCIAVELNLPHFQMLGLGEEAQFLCLLQVDVSYWQQKQRDSNGNSAVSLSSMLSPGNLPLLPAQLHTFCITLKAEHLKIPGLVHIYASQHLFFLYPEYLTPRRQVYVPQLSGRFNMNFCFCSHVR